MFIGRAEAEALILWPSDAKSWLTGKDLDAGKVWGQEEKGATRMRWLYGSSTQWTWVWDSEIVKDPVLACCTPRSCKEWDPTGRLNNNTSYTEGTHPLSSASLLQKSRLWKVLKTQNQVSIKGFGAKESIGQEVWEKFWGRGLQSPRRWTNGGKKKRKKRRRQWPLKIKIHSWKSQNDKALNSQVLKIYEDSFKARNHALTWDESLLYVELNFQVGKCQGPKTNAAKDFKQWRLGTMLEFVVKQKAKSAKKTEMGKCPPTLLNWSFFLLCAKQREQARPVLSAYCITHSMDMNLSKL